MNRSSTGLIFTVFGSNQSQVSLGLAALQEAAKQRFNLPVRLAFTSDRMRQRLAIERKKSDSLSKAIQKMAFEQFRNIVVQPLQVIPGLEYHELEQTVHELQSPKLKIIMGQPLLRLETSLASEPLLDLSTNLASRDSLNSSNSELPLHATLDSLNCLAKALYACIPTERQKEDLVLFMGHGSKHKAQACYVDLCHTLQAWDAACAVGTLSGALPLETLLQKLEPQLKAQLEAQRKAQLGDQHKAQLEAPFEAPGKAQPEAPETQGKAQLEAPETPGKAQLEAQNETNFQSKANNAPQSELKKPRVWLVPLLASVGKHILEDMVHGEHSWKKQLELRNYEVFPIIRGLSEHPSVVEVWLDNAAEALEKVLA